MSNKIKFPCCVDIDGLFKFQVDSLVEKFVALGAEAYETTSNCDHEQWDYIGVDDRNRTYFYDHVCSFDKDRDAYNVTVYNLNEVLAATGVGDKVEGTSEPLPDGWIEWKGGEQPVENNTRVEVRFRGTGSYVTEANVLRWRNADEVNGFCPSVDIIAYRVIAAQGSHTARLASPEYQPTEVVVDELKPLLNVIKHLSYTVEIKGIKFELTDEEYQELINQLEDGM